MNLYTDQLDEIADRILTAKQIVCLTGAGASAESGVPTFREAQTGLWERFDPEELASQAGFAANPGLVWQWYMSRLKMVEAAEPNAGHRSLAVIESLSAGFTLRPARARRCPTGRTSARQHRSFPLQSMPH
jgi:NAD-dependent deacetylase